MSYYCTEIFDCYIQEKYRPFISEVYRTESWLEFPSAEILENYESVDFWTRTPFFPHSGSWDEETGHLSFVIDYNHNSRNDVYQMTEIFESFLPEYCMDYKPVYFSRWGEDYEEYGTHIKIFELNKSLCGKLRFDSIPSYDNPDYYNAAYYIAHTDEWEPMYPQSKQKDPEVIVYNNALYSPHDLNSLSGITTRETNADSIETLTSRLIANGGSFVPVAELISENGTLTIPSGITHISDDLFSGMKNVTAVVIPEGVLSIGNSAFENCTNLRSIKLPNSLEKIGEKAFCNTALTEVSLPDRVEQIMPYTFFGCLDLKNVKFPRNLKTVGKRSFAFCISLSEVCLPEGTKELHWGAFSRCSALHKASLQHGLLVIAYNVFSKCGSLSSLTIPSTVRYIGDQQRDERFNENRSSEYNEYGFLSEDKSVFPEDKEGFTLRGIENSTAHYYALFHGIEFEILPL